jgi:hypothetical protein
MTLECRLRHDALSLASLNANRDTAEAVDVGGSYADFGPRM